MLQLLAGDVLMFPRGAAHTLRSIGGGDSEDPADNTPAQRHFNGVLTEVTRHGAENPLDMLCGTFVVGGAAACCCAPCRRCCTSAPPSAPTAPGSAR